MTSMRRPEWLIATAMRKQAARAIPQRRPERPVDHKTAEIAAAAPASRIVLGPPTTLSSGTTVRQASAPPSRSAPYNNGIRFVSRANTTENSTPVKKKGTAEATYIFVSRKKFLPVRSSDTRPCSTTYNKTAIATAIPRQIRPASTRVSVRDKDERIRYANTPPAPSPSSATEIARNAKW